MTRRKIRLTYIKDDSERKASFKKRKNGLLKKVHELTVLCDVEACAIIYSPFDHKPEVWPSVDGMRRTVARFKSLPEPEQTRRMFSQEKITNERIDKLHTKLVKVMKNNREKQMTQLMYQCLAGEQTIPTSMVDLNDLGWVTEKHLKEVNDKLDALMKEVSTLMSPPSLAPVLGQAYPHVLTGMNNEISDSVVPTMVDMQNYQGNNVYMLSPELPHFHLKMGWNGSWLPNVNTNSTHINNPQEGLGSSNNP